MRVFDVWLDRNVVGAAAVEEVIEMPDDASDAECDAACRECLETMISNELDTGWNERAKKDLDDRLAVVELDDEDDRGDE